MDINYKRALTKSVVVFIFGIGFPWVMLFIHAFIQWNFPIALNELGQSMVNPWIRAWILLGLCIGFGTEMRDS